MALTVKEVTELVNQEIENVHDPDLGDLLRRLLVTPSRHESTSLDRWGQRWHCTFWIVANHPGANRALVVSDDFYDDASIVWGATSFNDPYFVFDEYTAARTRLEDALTDSFSRGLITSLRWWNVVEEDENARRRIIEFGIDLSDALTLVRRLNWKLRTRRYRIVPNPLEKRVGRWGLYREKGDGTREVIASSLSYDEALDRWKKINRYFVYPLYRVDRDSQ